MRSLIMPEAEYTGRQASLSTSDDTPVGGTRAGASNTNAGGVGASMRRRSHSTGDGMEKWKYRTTIMRDLSIAESKLNAEGEKVWVLVAICLLDNNTARAFFKARVEAPAEAQAPFGGASALAGQSRFSPSPAPVPGGPPVMRPMAPFASACVSVTPRSDPGALGGPVNRTRT